MNEKGLRYIHLEEQLNKQPNEIDVPCGDN